MSKSLILILFVIVLWIVIVRKRSHGFSANGFQGGVSPKGSTHSSGGGAF